MLEDVLHHRATVAGLQRFNRDLAALVSTLAAVLHRTDPQLCARALDEHGFTLHDFFAPGHPPHEIDEGWIDEIYTDIATDQ